MFLFLKLYLAHLIGDFVLQFEELYRLKVRSVLGHAGHVLIHVLVSILLTQPYWGQPVLWIFIGLLAVEHLIQDLIKYNLQKKHPAITFPLFVVDQMIHFLAVRSVLLFSVSKLQLGFPEMPVWNLYYTENAWTLYAIAFLWVTFGGSYLLHNFRKNYLPGSRPDHLITPLEMSHAIVERSCLAGAFLFSSSPLVWTAAAFPALLRLAHPKLRNATDLVMSLAWAALIGFLFRLWV